jgi:hypothetical protein
MHLRDGGPPAIGRNQVLRYPGGQSGDDQMMSDAPRRTGQILTPILSQQAQQLRACDTAVKISAQIGLYRDT